MAEANVMEVEMVDFQGGGDGGGRSPLRYFCHKCVLEIDPKMPGFTCPRCDSGFIEEVSDNLQRDGEMAAATSSNVPDQFFMDHLNLLTSQPPQPLYSDEGANDDDAEALPGRRRSSISSLSTLRHRLHRRELVLPLHSFIESVLDSVRDDSYRRFGNDFSEPRLRRYGRHFRRSYSGLEDLFTQILTQLTAAGPEPASQEQIDELPVVKVNSHHLESKIQCSICLENFVLDEEGMSLPCNHLHHKFCIIPWLQLHATCPVCRHLLPPSASREPALARGSSFRFTERNDLSLDPGDGARFRTRIEEPHESVAVDLTIHSPWLTVPPLTDSAEAEDFADVLAIRRSNSASVATPPDVEMVNLDNNNVATMDEEFDRGGGGGRYDGRSRDLESFMEGLELPSVPARNATCLRDIEVTGMESEGDL